MLVLANPSVPKSQDYPHQGEGTDYDSIGLFQQRASIYTNIAMDMSPSGSAEQFYDGMKRVKGWETMPVGELCQAVQRSAYPTAYDKHVSQAEKICAADGY